MASAVAHRYANALLDIVLGPGSPLPPEDAVAQLAAVAALLAESQELRIALSTPAIQTSRKHAVMAKLLERLGTSELIRNFIYVVIGHRRIAILSDIRDAFELQLDERRGFVRAEVTSAVPLAAPMSAGLESRLSNLTGKRIRMRFDVDPALIGGVVARIGSTVYDGSVRGELRELGKKLAASSAE
jgi:F-type H+-transporting ATPase subunit delta